MYALIWLINALLTIAWWIVIIQVIMSWLINFNVINLHQPLVRQIWDGLTRLTEPMYRPIRNFLPSMGGLDLSPLIVLLGITFLQILFNRDIAPALVY
jgi:YggT family protein